MDTIIQILQNYGFERSTAKIYKLLVQNGESSISELTDMSELSRGGIYDALSSLQDKNLVQHRKDGRQALYKAENPDKLHYLKQEKENEIEQMNAQLESIIGQLKGEYNLAESKPGVRFFEGKDGFEEAIHDTLSAREEILAVVNPSEIENVVPEIEIEYVKERINQGVNKKILSTEPYSDIPNIEQYKKLTEVRLLPDKTNPFSASVQIYDNKVMYFTLTKESLISIIIEHKDIYEINKAIFNLIWNKSKKSGFLEPSKDLQEKMKEEVDKN